MIEYGTAGTTIRQTAYGGDEQRGGREGESMNETETRRRTRNKI
jgi:hypothetical protein